MRTGLTPREALANSLFTSTEGRRLCFHLCLSVCLSVGPLDYSDGYKQILMKFSGGCCAWPNNQMDFGVDLDNNPDPGSGKFLKDSLFTIAIPTDREE